MRSTSIISRTASSPRDKVFICGEDRHISAYLRKDLDCCKGIFIKSRDCSYQIKRVFVFASEAKDLLFYFFLMLFQLRYMVKTFS